MFELLDIVRWTPISTVTRLSCVLSGSVFHFKNCWIVTMFTFRCFILYMTFVVLFLFPIPFYIYICFLFPLIGGEVFISRR